MVLNPWTTPKNEFKKKKVNEQNGNFINSPEVKTQKPQTILVKNMK